MNLATLQQEFMGHVLAEDRPLPGGWNPRLAAGLAVYRNAYRARLIDALAETFPRTREWLGEGMFDTAAAHHLILNPPASWTLDLAGDGFCDTLAELFAADPDVPDLAWLEWAMHLAYTARDCRAIDGAGFTQATAGFGEPDWADMRMAFVPSLQLRAITGDCVSLWRTLGEGRPPAVAPLPDAPAHCLVWREGLDPVCALVPMQEGDCLHALRTGASFGEVCGMLAQVRPSDDAATLAGAMLGQWLARGIVATVT